MCGQKFIAGTKGVARNLVNNIPERNAVRSRPVSNGGAEVENPRPRQRVGYKPPVSLAGGSLYRKVFDHGVARKAVRADIRHFDKILPERCAHVSVKVACVLFGIFQPLTVGLIEVLTPR